MIVTWKKLQVLAAIEWWLEHHHQSPSLRELAKVFNVHVSSIKQHVDRLRALGLLNHHANGARTLRPTCKFIDMRETNQ